MQRLGGDFATASRKRRCCVWRTASHDGAAHHGSGATASRHGFAATASRYGFAATASRYGSGATASLAPFRRTSVLAVPEGQVQLQVTRPTQC